ncbi:MAG TPA: response regulator transcription factor [Thermoleophilaceae bacterium]|nr:response regulator transcription factor [Thermoleophilaceae bacterium]
MKVRVAIADDHQLTLEGVRRILDADDGFDVVGTATSGSQVLPLMKRTQPDLLLLDIRLPGIDGITCLDLLRKNHPAIKVVMLSAYTGRDQVETALSHGASAYVAKTVNPADLPAALRQVLDGTVYHAIGVVEESSAPEVDADLTERELSVLRALSRGLSNKAIGHEFWVTEQTVKFHLGNIYRKLGVANRTAAVHYAHEHGLVQRAL